MNKSKVYEIANILELEILSNCKIGCKIGSENELIRRFNVSRITIRNSLRILINKGILRNEKARGYFVCEQNLWSKLLSFSDLKSNQIRRNTLINIDIKLDSYFISNFNLESVHFSSFIKLRYKNNLMTKYSIIWYNNDLIRKLDFLAVNKSFLQYIESKNIHLKHSYKKIIFSLKNDFDKKYLINCNKYEYLPKKYCITFDQHYDVVECSLETYLPETFCFNKIEHR